MESEIWTSVCWLMAGESLEANIYQASKKVLPWNCPIAVPHGRVQKPLCQFLCFSNGDRQLPYHDMSGTNHIRGVQRDMSMLA